MPGKCFISVKENHSPLKCVLFQPLAGNDQVIKKKRSKKKENASM
jgi:hypothetical protein